MANFRFGRRLGIAALVIATAAAPASAIVFDFNEQTPTATAGSGSETGSLGALSTQAEGVTLLVSRTVAGFDAAQINNPSQYPPGWAPIVLDPFAFATTDDYFVGNFSEPMQSVSVSLTDFFQDADLATLEAFSEPDAGGQSLDFDSAPFSIDSTSPAFVTVNVTGVAIRSIRFRGGSTLNPNSMYADNVVATPTPEPGLDLALPVAAAALVSLRRGRTGRLGRPAKSR